MGRFFIENFTQAAIGKTGEEQEAAVAAAVAEDNMAASRRTETTTDIEVWRAHFVLPWYLTVPV